MYEGREPIMGGYDEEGYPLILPRDPIERWLFLNDGDRESAVKDASREMFALLYREGERYSVAKRLLAAHAGAQWFRGANTCLEREEWRDLFRRAGYREDDVPTRRPDSPLVLWRGATPENRANWSWTDVRDTALMFASGWIVQKERGLVWRATVGPERLLAKLSGLPEGGEYVVDTEGLVIEPDGLWCRCDVNLEPFRAEDGGSRIALDLHELVLCPRG